MASVKGHNGKRENCHLLLLGGTWQNTGTGWTKWMWQKHYSQLSGTILWSAGWKHCKMLLFNHTLPYLIASGWLWSAHIECEISATSNLHCWSRANIVWLLHWGKHYVWSGGHNTWTSGGGSQKCQHSQFHHWIATGKLNFSCKSIFQGYQTRVGEKRTQYSDGQKRCNCQSTCEES